MNFFGVSFGLLTLERGGSFSKAMNHFVYIYVMVFFVIFRFGGIPQKAAKLEAKLKLKETNKKTE